MANGVGHPFEWFLQLTVCLVARLLEHGLFVLLDNDALEACIVDEAATARGVAILCAGWRN